MVARKNGDVDVGSVDVGERQPTANGASVPEIEGIKSSSGKVCIECQACGFAVMRTESYVRSMKTMKCPHCLTNYRVKL